MEQRPAIPPATTLLVLVATALGSGLLLLVIAAGLSLWLPEAAPIHLMRLGGLLLLLAPAALTMLGLLFVAARGTILLWSLACREWDLHLERRQARVLLPRDSTGRVPLLCLPTADGYLVADPDRAPAAIHVGPSLPAELRADPPRIVPALRAGIGLDGGQTGDHGPVDDRMANDHPAGQLPLLATAGVSAPASDSAVPIEPLPELIDLAALLRQRRPTSEQLLLGFGVDGPIYADLQHLMHTGLGGATGWGKSAASLQLATQLGCCPDVLLAVADPDAVSFQPLEDADRLCLPMPASAAQSKQVLEAIQDEIAARYRLIGEGWRRSGRPMQSAADYNRWCAVSGEPPILPLVLLVDEWPELVQLGAAPLAASIVRRGRKASVYAVLAGQGWTRPDAGETGIRRQLHTVYQLGVKELADARPLAGTDGARRLWERIAAGRLRPGDALLQRAGPFPDVFVRVPFIEPSAATELLMAMPRASGQGLVTNGGIVSPGEKASETLADTPGAGAEFRNAETGFSASQSVSAFQEPSVDPVLLARIAELRAEGAGKTAIVRAVWDVSSGPRYQAAAREYDRYLAHLDREHPARPYMPGG